MPLTRSLLAAACGAALALSACGGDDAATTASTTAAAPPDDAQLAERAVTDYVAAFTDRDADRACSLMTDRGRAHVQRLQEVDDCPEAVERILAGVPDEWMDRFRSLRISDIEIRGDLAIVQRPDDADDGVAAPPVVRRVGDAWLVEFER